MSDEVLAWLCVWSEVQMTGPAVATSTPSSLFQKNAEWLIILVPAYQGCLGKKAIKQAVIFFCVISLLICVTVLLPKPPGISSEYIHDARVYSVPVPSQEKLGWLCQEGHLE